MRARIACLTVSLICLVTLEYAAAQFTIDFETLPDGTVIPDNGDFTGSNVCGSGTCPATFLTSKIP